MNKSEYLEKLYQSLAGLPQRTRMDIMSDYEEHFRSGLESGRSEEEIAASLGDPYMIGSEVRKEYPAMPPRPAFRPFRAIWMTFAMLFFNLIFVLGPFLGVLGLLLGLWATAFGMSLAGVAAVGVIIFSTISASHRYLMDTGLSFITIASGSVLISSMGAILGIGCWYLSKMFVKATAVYAAWNLKAIVGRRD